MASELLKMVEIGRVKERLFEHLESGDVNVCLSAASLLIQLYRLPTDEMAFEMRSLIQETRRAIEEERASKKK